MKRCLSNTTIYLRMEILLEFVVAMASLTINLHSTYFITIIIDFSTNLEVNYYYSMI